MPAAPLNNGFVPQLSNANNTLLLTQQQALAAMQQQPHQPTTPHAYQASMASYGTPTAMYSSAQNGDFNNGYSRQYSREFRLLFTVY